MSNRSHHHHIRWRSIVSNQRISSRLCLKQTQTDPENTCSVRPVYNNLELISFLGRVEPQLSRQLLENIKSRAFDGHFTCNLDYSVNWEDEVETRSCSHVLNHKDRDPELACTDVSWSITGSTIAVSYFFLT